MTIWGILIGIASTDWACELGYLPSQVMWLPEVATGLLFLKAISYRASRRRRVAWPGLGAVGAFVVFAVLSGIYNDIPAISVCLFFREILRYYLLFLAMCNLDLDERMQRQTVSLVILMFLSQIPVSVVKLALGWVGERPLFLNGHSMTTIIALWAIGVSFACYFVYRRSLVYILVAFGFLGFGMVGGKRGIIFLLPVVLSYTSLRLGMQWKSLVRIALVGIVLLCPAVYFCFRLLPTLNPERTVWGTFSPQYALEYALAYETAVDQDGNPIGRSGATAHVFSLLRGGGLPRLALGCGPGCILKSMFSKYSQRYASIDRFGVGYGLNGLNWLGLQVGYAGFALYLLFFLLIQRYAAQSYMCERDPYWRTLMLAILILNFIVVVVGSFYTPVLKNDFLGALYYCLAAICVIRHGDASTHKVPAHSRRRRGTFAAFQ